MRGENHATVYLELSADGTSPHAWGKPSTANSAVIAARNIPTCVGKTRRCGPPRFQVPEHPHMRGENWRRRRMARCRSGTSPHAWGKLQGEAETGEGERNIPTCVGKTPTGRAQTMMCTEHPHMRGENRRRAPCMIVVHGTSPHAWGKPFR